MLRRMVMVMIVVMGSWLLAGRVEAQSADCSSMVDSSGSDTSAVGGKVVYRRARCVCVRVADRALRRGQNLPSGVSGFSRADCNYPGDQCYPR